MRWLNVLSLILCACVSLCEIMFTLCVQEPVRPEEDIESPRIEFQVVVSCRVGVGS